MERSEGGALIIILVVERSEAGACYVNDGTTACKLVAPLSLFLWHLWQLVSAPSWWLPQYLTG